MEALIKILMSLKKQGFWGEIQVTMKDGNPVVVLKKESIRID